MRAKLRHTGMTNAIALDHSIAIIQKEKKSDQNCSAHLVKFSAVISGERFLSRKSGEGLSRRDQCGYGTVVDPRSSRFANSPLFVGGAALRTFAPVGRSLQFFRRTSFAPTIHRNGDIFAKLERSFCGNIVRGSESRQPYLPIQHTDAAMQFTLQSTRQVIKRD
jgi:hypothetical protein